MVELEKYLKRLEETDKEHVKYAKSIMEADSSKMYPLDFFVALLRNSVREPNCLQLSDSHTIH
ncbi:hypothetical protein Q5N47_17995 [Vibrio cholerae]|uniref:hypothetical protein n=1 Tax=Vibrio cholerae TaxID=666 RepID=UPI0029352A5E|nr:hypothetical protein [Vibrio cholerae]MDV2373078.1 hypothetical protein [Vibrio cholerae]